MNFFGLDSYIINYSLKRFFYGRNCTLKIELQTKNLSATGLQPIINENKCFNSVFSASVQTNYVSGRQTDIPNKSYLLINATFFHGHISLTITLPQKDEN